jgi:hypothetical protein
MRHRIAAALALALPTLAVSQGSDPPATTHDARPLLRPFHVGGFPRHLPLHAAFASKPEGGDERQLLAEDQLVEFLRAAARAPEAEVEVTGGHVLVKGPPAARQAVSGMLAHLSRTLLQDVTVTVYGLAATPETPSGVLTAAETDRFLAGPQPPVELARTSALVGEPRTLRAGRSTRFVSDYEVEVAERAAIADPVVRVLHEGLDLQARVGETGDGRFLLRFGCTRSALAEALATRSLGSTRLGDVQLPKVLSTVFVASAVVEDGGAIAVRHDGGLGAGTLVRVRRSGPRPAPTQGVDHQVLHAEDLVGGPLRVPVPSVRGVPGANQDEDVAAEPTIPPDESPAFTTEMLSTVVERALGDGGATRFQIVGTSVHVQGPEAAVAKAREAVAALSRGLPGNVVVEFRLGRGDATPLPADLGELAGRLGAHVAAPVATSDQFVVAAGLEQAAVVDHDVEIAQRSTIADPQVAPLFSGYVISGVAVPAGQDKVELLLDLRRQEVLPLAQDGFPSRADSVGPIDLPQIEETASRGRLILERGRWAVAALSNPGETAAVVILVRVR